jgi:hypothetical protein
MFQTHHSLAGRNERYANDPFDGPKLKPVRPAAIGAKVALLAGDGLHLRSLAVAGNETGIDSFARVTMQILKTHSWEA